MYTYRTKRKNPIKRKTSNRKYYRYMGFVDGSGRPEGLVIKCFTEEEYKSAVIKGGKVFKILE